MRIKAVPKSAQRGIQSIDVGGKLLSALMARPSRMTLKELSGEAGIASAQAHAYLSSFKRLDLVVQDQADGRYALGPLALHLGLSYIAGYAPLRQARNAAALVAEETGLMTVLAIWSNGAPTAIDVRPGREQLNVNVQPGSIFPLDGSSVGFVFAAFMPKDKIDVHKHAETMGAQSRMGQWHLNPKEFAKRVAETRSHGFASLVGQPIFGINSLSVPVFQKTGEFVATLMLMGNDDSLVSSQSGELTKLIKIYLTKTESGDKRG